MKYKMGKFSGHIALLACLQVAGMLLFLPGCENPKIKKAGERIKETTSMTSEAAKNLGHGISEETKSIIEEIKKGSNVVVTEIKEGGIFVSKKGEELIDRTKEEFSEVAITARIKAKYTKSPKVSALHINVATVKDRVILTGKAHCKEEVIEAINLALGVEGVENITSLLEIKK